MEKLTRIVSGKRYEKKTWLSAQPTLRCTFWTGREFFSLLSRWNWMAYKVRSGKPSLIIFQRINLQRFLLVTGTKNICVKIDAWLELWNKGAFDELVWDSYAASTGYLGPYHRNQSDYQCQRTVSTLVLHGMFSRSSDFFANRSQGEFYNPMKSSQIKWDLRRKPTWQCWWK